MPVHHRRTTGQLRTQRRKRVWATFDQSVTIPAGQISNSNLLAGLSVAGSSLLGVTIARTHLRIMTPTVMTAAAATRFGLIVGRNTDVGLNVAGQQDPANPELDWMLLDRREPVFSGATANSTQEWSYDVKAQRKMEELNQAYILAITNTIAISVTYVLWARVLVLLP